MENYDRIRDQGLRPRSLTEAQVQVVWMKMANREPVVSLPSPAADAYLLLERLGAITRALRARYPNLKQVFVSSRTYGGYATTRLNPEPYAFESGLSVKWLVEAQIRQTEGRAADPRAGALRFPADAPWLAWGPYLWARGPVLRSDGLSWRRRDFEGDGVHPNFRGEEKVGSLLLDFFRASPYTRCWFLRNGVCG
jgi:hypothetical protein